MTRTLQKLPSRTADQRRNFAAAVVAGGAIALMYYSFKPASADEHASGHTMRTVSLSQEVTTTPREVPSKPERSGSAASSTSAENSVESIETATTAGNDSNALTSRYGVLFTISQLQRGMERLERLGNYSTVLERQERINGELQEPQQIEMKLRHAPFSVYMKWLSGDKGRELLYTDKENEGKMLVKLGGLKGRFIPTVKLDPLGDRAMSETRHPVTQAGLVNLAQQIINHRQQDLARGVVPQCVVEEGHTFNGRPCYKLLVDYASQQDSPLYRKSVTMIDEELSLPVYVRNYTWPTENTVDVEVETLIECYSYTDIRFEKQLSDVVWKTDNPEYRFVR